jgi:MFS family permease
MAEHEAVRRDSMFIALKIRNYRLYVLGQTLSNTAAWMSRLAQDWLVLDLTGSSGIALGITTALQFTPYLLFSLWGGTLADRFSPRRLLLCTQSTLAVLALVLGILTLRGDATVAVVYGFALLAGCASALENPCRQAFVQQLVGADDLHNAVALSSASFNIARLSGPALSGLLVAVFGTGFVFLIITIPFLISVALLLALRPGDFSQVVRDQGRVTLRAGADYVRARPNLMLVLAVAFIVPTLALNFQLTMALIARQEFHVGAQAFGLMSTALATGALVGSLAAARQPIPTTKRVVILGILLGVADVIVGLAPSYGLMLVLLPLAGATAMQFSTSAESYLQNHSATWVRGRVMGMYGLAFFGAAPLGCLLIGWAADQLGARSSLFLGGASASVLTVITVGLFLMRWPAESLDAEPEVVVGTRELNDDDAALQDRL